MVKSFKDYPELMTVEEVAEYLRISLPMAYQMAQQGTLPGLKVGHLWRFYKSDIEKFLAKGQVVTRPMAVSRGAVLFNKDILLYHQCRLGHKIKNTPRGGWLTVITDEDNLTSPTVKVRFRKVRLTDGKEAIVLSRGAYARIPENQRPRWEGMRIK